MMDLKRALTLIALVTMVAAMAGCSDSGGGGGGGGAKFEDSTTTQTLSDYCGDPEHGTAPDTVEFMFPASATAGNDSEEEPPPESPGEFRQVTFSRTYTSSGMQTSSNEGTSSMEVRIYAITAKLSWVDSDGAESDPDMFELVVECGEESGQESGEGDSSAGGNLEITLEVNGSSESSDDYMANSAKVTVRCIEAGFTHNAPTPGLILRLGAHDEGNDFRLDVEYKAWVQ